MRRQTSDIRPTYRHFERSEKSLSFAVWRSMIGNSKRETRYLLTFGHRPIYIAAKLPPQPRTLNPKLFSKNLLTQERQYGKIIPIADEAAPFERVMKKISKKSFDKPL